MTPFAVTEAAAPAVRSERTSIVTADSARLRQEFPARPAQTSWASTARFAEAILHQLRQPPFLNEKSKINGYRQRGAAKALRWLDTMPGGTWQQRWLASGSEDLPGRSWVTLPLAWRDELGETVAHDSSDLLAGLSMLICADVVRPSARWLLSRKPGQLTNQIRALRDADGIGRLDALVANDPSIPQIGGRMAICRIAMLVASKGGTVADIVPGDCVELFDAMSFNLRGAGTGGLFYQMLRSVGVLTEQAPATIRAFRQRQGQLSVEQLVDRHGIQSREIRALFIDYLTERQPALDYGTLTALTSALSGLFWADLERHHPGINSLHLTADVARGWKDRIKTKIVTARGADGQPIETRQPRTHYKQEMITVRSFYRDLAAWAVEDPARWGPFAAPCPIRDNEVDRSKDKPRHKARMDQRTRERLPALPHLVRCAQDQMDSGRALLQAGLQAQPGALFTVGGLTLRRGKTDVGRSGQLWAVDEHGRRNLTRTENRAFWAWAAIEVLRHTGIRIEELGELSHHSITQYRLPSTGELVPLLQIAPSKSDTERLLLVGPELADVLSAIVSRIRKTDGSVPLIASYDPIERVWQPPMPLLFQMPFGGEIRPITAETIRSLLTDTIAVTGLTSTDGHPLRFTPHDFRRLFVTDAVLNGLPPHIAQVLCGHRDINTTMGYKAIYPQEAIEAHRAFIGRRRATRPGEEYRTPTEQEWDAFLAHFERRKLSVGTCARAFGTPCIHEHACVRCAMLRPDAAQRGRLVEIRDNLEQRIAEARREGWLGEIEGLQISLRGSQDKIDQIDTAHARSGIVDLGIPAFGQIARRSGTADAERPQTGSSRV